jgi:hypothetical protein
MKKIFIYLAMLVLPYLGYTQVVWDFSPYTCNGNCTASNEITSPACAEGWNAAWGSPQVFGNNPKAFIWDNTQGIGEAIFNTFNFDPTKKYIIELDYRTWDPTSNNPADGLVNLFATNGLTNQPCANAIQLPTSFQNIRALTPTGNTWQHVCICFDPNFNLSQFQIVPVANNGGINVRIDNILISEVPDPVPTTTTNITICEGDEVVLSDDRCWDWSGTGAYLQNDEWVIKPSLGTAISGSRVGIGGCVLEVKNFLINVNPKPQIISQGYQVCVNNVLTLDPQIIGTGPFQYNWEKLGSPVTISPNGPLSIIVSEPGISTYRLTITDANGCVSSADMNVYGIPIPTPPQVDITGGGCDKIVCFLPEAQFDVLYTVDFGDGSPVDNFSGTSPAAFCHEYAIGTYTFSITASNTCGSETTIHSIEVFDTPELQGSSYQACSGSVFTITPSISGGTPPFIYQYSCGNASANGSINLVYNTPGTYTCNLIITDANGCTDSTVYDILIDDTIPTPILNSPSPVCEPLGYLSITNQVMGENYFIDWGDNSPVQLETIPRSLAHNYSPGIYTITVSASNSCDSVAQTTQIEVLESPQVSIQQTGDCDDALISLQAIVNGGTPPYTLTWDNGSTTPDINVNPAGVHTYTVTVTDANNCSSTATIEINCCIPNHPFGPDPVFDLGVICVPDQDGNMRALLVIPDANGIYGSDPLGILTQADIEVELFCRWGVGFGPLSPLFPPVDPQTGYVGNDLIFDFTDFVLAHGCNNLDMCVLIVRYRDCRSQGFYVTHDIGLGFHIDCCDEAEATGNLNTLQTQVNEDLEVKLFPNPTARQLNVEVATQVEKISVIDMGGTEVILMEDAHAGVNSLDVSHLKKGMYLVKVYADGKYVAHKFIKN